MNALTAIQTESGFEIVQRGVTDIVVEQSPDGVADVRATATNYEATHPGGHRLAVRYVESVTGERWVECHEVDSPVPLLQRLRGSLRLAVLGFGDSGYCELRQAQPKGERWANLFKADHATLDRGAGVSVARELRGVGASDVGSRELLLGDSSRRRSFLCATFDLREQRVPVLAFLLTRALPLIRT